MKYTPESLSNLLYTNFLIVGPYKTGKTMSLTTLHKLRSKPWVKGSKLYIYDFDEGCQPLLTEARKGGWLDEVVPFRYGLRAKIDQGTGVATSKDPIIDFITDINSLYNHLTPSNDWTDDFLSEAPYAMCFDSLTAFQDEVQNFILAANNKIRDSEMSGDTGTMYRKVREKIVEVIRSVRSLPCFSVWCAHEQVVAETIKQPWTPKGSPQLAPRLTGEIKALPVVPGRLASTIGGEFGGVFYSRVKPDTSTAAKYIWVTRTSENIPGAGTRLKKGLPLEIPQDFSMVIE